MCCQIFLSACSQIVHTHKKSIQCIREGKTIIDFNTRCHLWLGVKEKAFGVNIQKKTFKSAFLSVSVQVLMEGQSTKILS